MSEAKKERINLTVNMLREEINALRESSGSLKVKIKSTPEHIARLKTLSQELKALSLGDD